jgi:hypothetical protein
MAQQFNPMPTATVRSRKTLAIVLSAVVIVGFVVALVVWAGTRAEQISTPVITTRVDHTAGGVPPHQTLIPADSPTIYALVMIHTRHQATVVARWYRDGQHLDEADTSQDIPAGYQDWFAFKIANKAPWPTGIYKVEFYLAGEKQTEQTFQVK